MGQSIQGWPSKICGRQPLKNLKGIYMVCLSRPHPFKIFKFFLFVFHKFDPFLNTLSQVFFYLEMGGDRKSFKVTCTLSYSQLFL